MQAIRQIIDNAQVSIAIPVELRHPRIELILLALDELSNPIELETHQADANPSANPSANPRDFVVAEVDEVLIPAREARNARR